MITKDYLKYIGVGEEWLIPLNKSFNKYNITDNTEIAMFMAQCCHESNNFKRLIESFNYTPERLVAVFPKRFKTLDEAKALVSKGQTAIANFLYNGRMGNIIGSNDGYNYRGRGIIQLTGRNNYKLYSSYLDIDLLNTPILACEPDNACLIACEFWKRNNISVPARTGNVIEVTKIINGGMNGIADRIKLLNRIRLYGNGREGGTPGR